MTTDAVPGPESGGPALYAATRIRDAAADYSTDDEGELAALVESVRFHAAGLDAGALAEVAELLAVALSSAYARPVREHRGDDDRLVADRAARGIVVAAQNFADMASFDSAFALHTNSLTRRQLARVTAALAAQLGCFYSADPFTDQGRVMVDALEEWARRNDGDDGVVH